jgi:hypothetical protein
MTGIAVFPALPAAVAAAVGFLMIAAFQLALALGAPLGRAAWGGGHTRLPVRLRVSSAVAVLVWAVAAVIVLGRVGLGPLALPTAVYEWGTWLLVVVLILGAIVNFVSRSRWERFFWAPFSVILAVMTLVVALSTGPQTP